MSDETIENKLNPCLFYKREEFKDLKDIPLFKSVNDCLSKCDGYNIACKDYQTINKETK